MNFLSEKLSKVKPHPWLKLADLYILLAALPATINWFVWNLNILLNDRYNQPYVENNAFVYPETITYIRLPEFIIGSATQSYWSLIFFILAVVVAIRTSQKHIHKAINFVFIPVLYVLTYFASLMTILIFALYPPYLTWVYMFLFGASIVVYKKTGKSVFITIVLIALPILANLLGAGFKA